MQRRRVIYALLIALLAISAVYQVGSAVAVVDNLQEGTHRARTPMDFGFRMRVISGIEPETIQAGIHWGDTLNAVDGQPFTGVGVLQRAVEQAHPGDLLPVEVTRKDGARITASIRLAPQRSAPPTLAEWMGTLGFGIALPVFCLCLGFWVAAVRPSDPLAWLLLALMLSFAHFVGSGAWHWPLPFLATAWHILWAEAWPIGMLLFGIRFPEASGFDRKRPWLKWLLAGPLIALAVLFAWFQLFKVISFDAVTPLRPVLPALYNAHIFLRMAAISVFFMTLGHKGGKASTRDARRRLEMLWIGACISLTPMFIEVVRSLIIGKDPLYGLPEWAAIGILLAFALFPLTLAYVVVVQRAMQVRGVVRQSVKYALARGGLWVMRALILIFAAVQVINLIQNPKVRKVDMVRTAGAVGLLFAIRRKYSAKISAALDRRFFREAYSAEQILSEIGDEARNFVEPGPLLETVTKRISDTLHVPHTAVLLKASQEYCPAYGTVRTGDCCLAAESRTIQYLRSTKRPALVYFDDPDSWVYEGATDDPRRLKNLDAQLLLPITRRDDLLGVMVLGPKLSEEPYSKTDIQLLQSVATQTGLALDNSRLLTAMAAEVAQRERLNREIEIAREVQERLFPQSYPPVPGIEYCGKCRPALAVGGDYYDFLPLADGKLGIAIGDISGKGISAALLMSGLRASLRGQTMAGLHDLAGLMHNVNLLVFEASSANRYATFFYGEYDPVTRRLIYVNAGHNAPMVLRGEVIRLDAGGPVVGLLKGAGYEQGVCQLEPGDVLVGFTDGISEAMTADDEEWEEERMLAALDACKHRSAAEMIDSVMAAADAFTAGAPQHDDMTLVVVKIS
ncbi:MAG: SpoIIE family protein phosphatase [Acidobacteriota bacterium]|nr:SpoIIE family protein phosphatase [Acidobacteriota bacterium]